MPPMSGIPGSEGIPPIDGIPPIRDLEVVELLEVDEEDDIMVDEDEDIEEEDIMLDIPPDCMRLEPREGPPNFMSPIIFFIMSSMPMSIPMAGMPPMPLPMSPMPRDIMGPAPPGPPELEVMVEDEEEEEENDIEDLVVPSGLWKWEAILNSLTLLFQLLHIST